MTAETRAKLHKMSFTLHDWTCLRRYCHFQATRLHIPAAQVHSESQLDCTHFDCAGGHLIDQPNRCLSQSIVLVEPIVCHLTTLQAADQRCLLSYCLFERTRGPSVSSTWEDPSGHATSGTVAALSLQGESRQCCASHCTLLNYLSAQSMGSPHQHMPACVMPD